jgi:hypothetical protein
VQLTAVLHFSRCDIVTMGEEEPMADDYDAELEGAVIPRANEVGNEGKNKGKCEGNEAATSDSSENDEVYEVNGKGCTDSNQVGAEGGRKCKKGGQGGCQMVGAEGSGQGNQNEKKGAWKGGDCLYESWKGCYYVYDCATSQKPSKHMMTYTELWQGRKENEGREGKAYEGGWYKGYSEGSQTMVNAHKKPRK